jgi:hypothetical protein
MNGMARSGVAAGAIALALVANAAQAQDAAAQRGRFETVDDANAIVVISTPGGAGVRSAGCVLRHHHHQRSRAGTRFAQEHGRSLHARSRRLGRKLQRRGRCEHRRARSAGRQRCAVGDDVAQWRADLQQGSLSFMDNSSIFRTDETIASTEAAHGGPNAVFSNGEVGVTLNFNLKKGGETTEGRVKLSATDYGSARADAVISGPLGHDLYYMIGGYVQQSPGIRDAQFKSEKGRQISAQLTKKFDNGEISIWTRVTDDHGQWYLPMALNTGNDLGTFSQLGNATLCHVADRTERVEDL